MWHLEYLPKEQEQEYLGLIIESVKSKRDSCNNQCIKDYLTEEKLKKILLSKPKELYTLQNQDELINKLWGSKNEFEQWKKAKAKKQRSKDDNEMIDKYKSIVDNIFDYKALISNKQNVAYEIAKLIGVNTCIYCNRQYIFTVEKNEKHIVRPDFDHYLPQCKYPFFALSLYNLIPSCHICNSNCKGTNELDDSMNPYSTNFENDPFTFTYHINETGFPSSVQIKDKELDKKVQTLLDTFKIQEIYNAHTYLELKDLYIFATKYSKTYLQDVLSKTITDLKLSQEEAYRILFGTEMFPNKDNDRPLSKFKRDILKELCPELF
jgi:hypothetical protein